MRMWPTCMIFVCPSKKLHESHIRPLTWLCGRLDLWLLCQEIINFRSSSTCDWNVWHYCVNLCLISMLSWQLIVSVIAADGRSCHYEMLLLSCLINSGKRNNEVDTLLRWLAQKCVCVNTKNCDIFLATEMLYIWWPWIKLFFNARLISVSYRIAIMYML